MQRDLPTYKEMGELPNSYIYNLQKFASFCNVGIQNASNTICYKMSILRYMINEKVGNQVGNAIFQGRNFGMPYHSDSLLHMRDFIIGKRVLFHTPKKIFFLGKCQNLNKVFEKWKLFYFDIKGRFFV